MREGVVEIHLAQEPAGAWAESRPAVSVQRELASLATKVRVLSAVDKCGFDRELHIEALRLHVDISELHDLHLEDLKHTGRPSSVRWGLHERRSRLNGGGPGEGAGGGSEKAGSEARKIGRRRGTEATERMGSEEEVWIPRSELLVDHAGGCMLVNHLFLGSRLDLSSCSSSLNGAWRP